MEDVKDIMGLLTEVAGNWTQAIEKRQQTEEFLQAAIASNGDCLQKLRLLAEKGQLSTSKTGGAFTVKKELKTILKRSKQEVIDAVEVWNDLTGEKIKVLNIKFFLVSHSFAVDCNVYCLFLFTDFRFG